MWRACVGLGSCPVLLPPVAVAWPPVVARGCVLLWGAVRFFFPPFFFLRRLVRVFPWFAARGAVVLGVLWSSRPAPLFMFFLFFVSPPPAAFFCFFFPSLVFFVCVLFLFVLPLCPFCGALVGLCVLRCGVCWCVLLGALCLGGGRFALVLCRWLLPGCACFVCVVARLVAVSWCVLCSARCCVACLCWAWFLPRAAAPCCRCLAPCRGPRWCSPLGCGALFFPPFFFLRRLVRVVPWFAARGAVGLGVLWSSRPAPLFVFFLFLFLPPPRPFFVSFFLLLFFLFVCCFYVFCLCAGSAVLWLVCVSSAVGCAGVCCWGPCALAGASLRLCCVVGCSLVVPVLCVLLPVLWRCRGVFCV